MVPPVRQRGPRWTLPPWAEPWAPLWPLLPALLVVLVYLPALSGGFVYDDGMIISDNRFTQEGSLWWLFSPDYYYGQIPEALGGSKEQSFRPLGTLTHMLECAVFWNGSAQLTHAGAFRLTSVYLHAINALLVCVASWRLLGISRAGAVIAGLCFALHPVATEAVVVASFREDLLCIFFLLIGLLCFGYQGRRAGAAGLLWSAGGAVAFFLAMASKEVGLIALPLALCAEWCAPPALRRPGPRNWNRAALRYGLIMVATVVYGLLRFKFFHSTAESSTPYPGGELGTLFSSCCTMIPVWGHYLRLFVLPTTLQADYMIPVRWSLAHPDVVRGALVLLAATAAGVAVSMKSRAARFGLIAAALALGPVSNVIPIRNICAERYLYVPLAGMAIALGAGAAWLWANRAARRPWWVGGAALLALCAAVRTVWRIPQWKSNDTIWAHVIGSQVLTSTAERPFPVPADVRGPFWTPGVEPLSTRGHMAVAGMYDRLGKWAVAEQLDAQSFFGAELVHCLRLVGTPWRIPMPGHDAGPHAPMVEVFSDAQVATRFISAWRILAEMRWIEFERFPELERNGAAAQARLELARHAVERCIKLYETEIEKGDPDFGMYDLRGRIYLAIRGMKWREYWSVRDRAYGAQRDAERFERMGRNADALPKFEEAVVYNRRALALGYDPAYRGLLAESQQTQIDGERWSVAADLGNCLTALDQPAEASQLFGLAREASNQDRAAGRWPLHNAVAWASIARGVKLSGESAGEPWVDVQGRPEADTIQLALQVLGAPTPAIAADESRRFAALGRPRAAHALARVALGDGSAEALQAADPEQPWSVAVDLMRLGQELGLEPAAAEVRAAHAAVRLALQQGRRPFLHAWERAFQHWNDHQAAASPVGAQRAVAALLRARWLATDAWYAGVASEQGNPEQRKMTMELWLIEHDLWWWYDGRLNRPQEARRHAEAALAAWDTRQRELQMPPATDSQSRQLGVLRAAVAKAAAGSRD